MYNVVLRFRFSEVPYRHGGVRADGGDVERGVKARVGMVETSTAAAAAMQAERADAERKHAAASGMEARVRMVEASSAA